MADLAVEDESVQLQRERERCATWCEHMARMLNQSAAQIRCEGTYAYRDLLLRRKTAILPGWERAAAERDEAAKIVRQVKDAITAGLEPKPLD